MIFTVARQNEQKIRKTICTQFGFLFIFFCQNIFFIVQSLYMRPYKDNKPDLQKIEDTSFFWIALEGAVLQPFLIYHLYVVTHKDKVSRKDQGDTSRDVIGSSELIKDASNMSSEFRWSNSVRPNSCSSHQFSSAGTSMRDSQPVAFNWHNNYDDQKKLL